MDKGGANISVLHSLHSFLHSFNSLDPKCNHSEEYKFTTYTVVFSFIFIFGFVCNVGALYVFCRFSIKNRLSTIFLIHLAVSDLVFILTLPPRIFYFSQSTSGSSSSLNVACRFSTYLFYISMYCSILFLTALSACRYLVLTGRVWLQNSVACRWARVLCWVIWGLVVGGHVVYITITSGFTMQAEGCMEPVGIESWAWLHHFNLVVLVIFFVLPLTVVLICYSLMIRHILKIQAGQRQRDVALLCLVLLIFCLCFLPYHIQRTLHLHYMINQDRISCHLQDTLKKAVVVTLCFAAFNSCLDPLIFLFVGHGFLSAMKRFVAQCGLQVQSKNSASPFPPVVQLPLVTGNKSGDKDWASPAVQPLPQEGETTV